MRIVQAFVREYRERARFSEVATTELTASLTQMDMDLRELIEYQEEEHDPTDTYTYS